MKFTLLLRARTLMKMGNEVRWWTVERFIFNDSGQIVHHGDINEDLLIAQQNGYKLSK